MLEQICSRCKKAQPPSEFYKRPEGRRQSKSHCRDCTREADRRRYHNGKKQRRDARLQELRATDLPKLRALQRRGNLSKYGITPEKYDTLLEAQGGACAICGTKDPAPFKTFAVDHCHVTDEVRGLLCLNCNQGIGKFKDDADRMRAAIAYLERHK